MADIMDLLRAIASHEAELKRYQTFQADCEVQYQKTRLPDALLSSRRWFQEVKKVEAKLRDLRNQYKDAERQIKKNAQRA